MYRQVTSLATKSFSVLSRRAAVPTKSSSHVALPSRAFSTTLFKMSSAPYEVVSTPNAPSAVGPYSQAIKTDNLIFISGNIPLDPKTGQIVGEGNVEEQATQALANLKAIVQASGSEISHVVKTTVFLKDMNDFARVNAIYEKFFAPFKPARSAVEVARLPKDVLFEIEAIATIPK